MTMRVFSVVLCVAAIAGVTVGCSSQQRREPAGGAVVQRGALPAYATIVKGYNARVADLDRVEALVALSVTAKNDKGQQIRNQVEGNLKVMLPSSVSLRVDKVSKPVFYLGSNERQYWWVDLTADPKVAMVGQHSKATPDAVKDFGVPVHPMDLIEVMAIRPLPPADGAEGRLARLAWSADGRAVVVRLPGRWGERRFWVNPETYDPIRIELLDSREVVVVSCLHTDFQPVTVVGNAVARPRITKRIEVSLPAQDATVVVAVYEPKNPGAGMRVQGFNLPVVLKNFNVEKVVDIDQARADNQSAAMMQGAAAESHKPGAATR